jgi:hypothetical protein
MKNVNRYDCGNGEGMFDNKTGYWVTHEDYKKLLDKYNKLALTIPDVSICPFEAYAVFCIECDRQGMKPINHKDYLKLG